MSLSQSTLKRRDMLRGAAATALAFGVHGAATKAARAQNAQTQNTQSELPAVKNGKIQQSVCQWCFNKMPVEQLAQNAQKMGLKGIDLVGPNDFATLKKYGLVSTMTQTGGGGFGISKGFNRKENHEAYIKVLRGYIEATSAAGFPNIICFSGNRDGLSDAEGLKNCAEGLKQIVDFAAEKNVTICMELLNSKVNHRDYQCDRTHWGADLVAAVDSPRFKLLYDIYHMQVQEGDVIATIRKYKDAIGHYHTAGVPGRNEIDPNSQELSYPPIMRAIAETGFKGYVAHEFIPRRDAMTSLAQAASICDI
jgi:hydroxypyruvate isomerase